MKIENVDRSLEISELSKAGKMVLYSGHREDIADEDYFLTVCVDNMNGGKDVWWVDEEAVDRHMTLVCHWDLESDYTEEMLVSMFNNYEAHIFEYGEPARVQEFAVILKECFDRGMFERNMLLCMNTDEVFVFPFDKVSLEKIKEFAIKLSKGVKYDATHVCHEV